MHRHSWAFLFPMELSKGRGVLHVLPLLPRAAINSLIAARAPINFPYHEPETISVEPRIYGSTMSMRTITAKTNKKWD